MDRNFLTAILLMFMVFFAWDMFVQQPKREALKEQEASQQAEGKTQEAAPAAAEMLLTREDALALAPGRVPIRTSTLSGTLNLRGARIDDLELLQYTQELDPDSPKVVLLNPFDSEYGWYVQASMNVNGKAYNRINWQAPEDAILSPETPLTLTHREDGFLFEQEISVDENYMFTVTQKVTNESGGPAIVSPSGRTVQNGPPPDLKKFMILHEGPVGVIDGKLYERKYQNLAKKGGYDEGGIGGWVGLTGKNWLGAVIPPQDAEMDGKLGMQEGDERNVYYASYKLEPVTVAAGDTYSSTSWMFAGPKVVTVLKSYEVPVEEGGLGIADFDKSIDWGNFNFLTRPIFSLLSFFFQLTHNYGVAMLLMTVVIKLVLFPLANMSFKSMAGMKKAQPELTELRDKYKDDNMKLQQEMAKLYKKHKINPALGCLPLLIQMPVFFALYKVLFVTIDSRHQPFLYIKDLSEADPTNLFNLFGLLPYDPTAVPVIGAFLGIGFLPLLMGVAMWVQMKLNPPPADPVQAQVFGLMPLIFIFIFAPFSAGLVLYWFWNTFLGVVQQYFIMKRNGAEVDILGNIKKSLPRRSSASASDDDK